MHSTCLVTHDPDKNSAPLPPARYAVMQPRSDSSIAKSKVKRAANPLYTGSGEANTSSRTGEVKQDMSYAGLEPDINDGWTPGGKSAGKKAGKKSGNKTGNKGGNNVGNKGGKSSGNKAGAQNGKGRKGNGPAGASTLPESDAGKAYGEVTLFSGPGKAASRTNHTNAGT